MSDPNWIEKATSKNKGSFRKAAQKHGVSTQKFVEQKKGAGGKTGKRAQLALTLMGMNKG